MIQRKMIQSKVNKIATKRTKKKKNWHYECSEKLSLPVKSMAEILATFYTNLFRDRLSVAKVASAIWHMNRRWSEGRSGDFPSKARAWFELKPTGGDRQLAVRHVYPSCGIVNVCGVNYFLVYGPYSGWKPPYSDPPPRFLVDIIRILLEILRISLVCRQICTTVVVIW